MTLADELEAVHAAAGSRALAGETVAAVMAAEPGLGRRVYLVAFELDGELSYLALNAELAPLDDQRLVREAVTMLGLAERAEEASIAVAAERLGEPFADAAQALESAGDSDAAASARAVGTALAALAVVADGPRLATPLYLDRIGAAASALGIALDEYRQHVEQLSERATAPSAAAEAAWTALAMATQAGDPSDFSQAMTATTGAVEALADDVLQRLRSYD